MSDKFLHYFAYGSNMHPTRLGERVPSSRQLFLASVAGYALRFHKRGQDGSAKCNLSYTGNRHDVVHGVVYAMLAREREYLDKAEGLGRGYDLAQLHVLSAEGMQQVFCYIADPNAIVEGLKPFDWYRALVLHAAEYQGFPDYYIEQIRRVETDPDPDRFRAMRYMRLAASL